MNLSVLVNLTRLQHHDDDTVDDSLKIQAFGCRPSETEVVIRHEGYSNPRVIRLCSNGLQLENRLLDTLALSLWGIIVGRPQFSMASEVVWEIADIRPTLKSMFYFGDAKRIERQIAAFQTLVIVGPSIFTAVID